MPDPPIPSRVAELELLSARSWRGLETAAYGDWLLRAGGGFTGRANSVLVVGDAPVPPGEAVAAVTRWYTDRGLRPRAQVPLPSGEAADAAFAAAGWERGDDVLVLTAPLDRWPAAGVPVDLTREPDEAWLTGYRYRGTPLPAVAPEVLLSADDPVFAAVRSGRPRAAASPACCRSSRPTPRRWRSTPGSASSNTTATTTDWRPPEPPRCPGPRVGAAGRPAPCPRRRRRPPPPAAGTRGSPPRRARRR